MPEAEYRFNFIRKFHLTSFGGTTILTKLDKTSLSDKGQPLTDPTVRPLIKYFWKNG